MAARDQATDRADDPDHIDGITAGTIDLRRPWEACCTVKSSFAVLFHSHDD
jgi:hypothetical protein